MATKCKPYFIIVLPLVGKITWPLRLRNDRIHKWLKQLSLPVSAFLLLRSQDQPCAFLHKYCRYWNVVRERMYLIVGGRCQPLPLCYSVLRAKGHGEMGLVQNMQFPSDCISSSQGCWQQGCKETAVLRSWVGFGDRCDSRYAFQPWNNLEIKIYIHKKNL